MGFSTDMFNKSIKRTLNLFWLEEDRLGVAKIVCVLRALPIRTVYNCLSRVEGSKLDVRMPKEL